MLDFESATPLYQQISDDIRQKILRGDYQAGQILPSETKCCEIYQVSRVTIRNAITDLVDQGLLVRKHGKGTFVNKQKTQGNQLSYQSFFSLCKENHIQLETHILCIQRQEASMHDIRALDLMENDHVVYLKRLFFANGHPVVIDHTYLPYDKYKFLLKMNMENLSLHEAITRESDTPIEKYYYNDISLQIGSATPEEALFLHIQDGSPLFVQKKTVYSELGSPVHWTKQLMSGNYFKFFLSNNNNKLTINLK